MSVAAEITNLESILINCTENHTPEELASMEEELFRLRHIQNLWANFDDVPMDPVSETIEQKWYHFPAGTHRETIWHWFEKEFSISITELLYD